MQGSGRLLFERARRGQTAFFFLRISGSGGSRRWMWWRRRLHHSILRTNRIAGLESVNVTIRKTGNVTVARIVPRERADVGFVGYRLANARV